MMGFPGFTIGHRDDGPMSEINKMVSEYLKTPEAQERFKVLLKEHLEAAIPKAIEKNLVDQVDYNIRTYFRDSGFSKFLTESVTANVTTNAEKLNAQIHAAMDKVLEDESTLLNAVQHHVHSLFRDLADRAVASAARRHADRQAKKVKTARKGS